MTRTLLRSIAILLFAGQLLQAGAGAWCPFEHRHVAGVPCDMGAPAPQDTTLAAPARANPRACCMLMGRCGATPSAVAATIAWSPGWGLAGDSAIGDAAEPRSFRPIPVSPPPEALLLQA